MKQMKLLELHLTNFKGIRNFSLVVNGSDTKVFGDNATGKTTLFDGFIWLLFDKDSQNQNNFQLKTTTQDGKEIHNLNHEVEGVFSVDGRTLTLKKVFSEKWTQKRGSARQEFTGHTTDYFIDGVPSKKKEYNEKVASIVSEDVFKLLTSPAFFNEQLHWSKRRETLLEVCGNITDKDVVASNKDLEMLMDVLNGRSIEDHKKVIAAKRKEINQELERIPIRIDEIKRGLPDIEGLNKSNLEKRLEDLNQQIEQKQEQINSIRNGAEINTKKKAISDIELEIANIRNEHNQNGQQDIYRLKTRIQEEESNISILNSKISTMKQRKQMNEDYIKDLNNSMDKLRTEWHEVNQQEFQHTDKCECPSCGQSLPEEQVSAVREKALAEFNARKSEKLERITKNGVDAKEKVEKIQTENEKANQEIQNLTSQIEVKKESIQKLHAQVSELVNKVTDITENPSYIAKLKEKEAIENEIEQLRKEVDESVYKVQEEIAGLKSTARDIQVEISNIIQAESSRNRISELEQQEKELAAEFEQLEQELYLTEEFTRTKVNLLEEKINSKFKMARFKLFSEQINGGLTETCETLYNGVPYSGGLNNAAKINVGLDIINTLSEHYGVQAPIFVDNSEAVTKLIDVDSQVISLVVSEKDKQLRVETDPEALKEAI